MALRIATCAGLYVALFAQLVACSRERRPGRPFSSLEAAVGAGVLDPEVLVEMQRSGRVQVLATLRFDSPPFRPNPERRLASEQQRWLDDIKARLGRLSEDLLKRHPRLEPIRRYDVFPVLAFAVPNADSLLQLVSDTLILMIVLDQLNTYQLAESIPLVGADRSQMWRQRGAGVGVALIDSGVDSTKSAFGTCPPTSTTRCSIALSQDVVPDDGMLDDVGHGTSMAEIIISVAPAASLIVFDADRTQRGVYDSDAITALGRVINRRADFNIRAVNMSFGHDQAHWTSPCINRSPYVSVFESLRTMGILPIVAAGNSAFPPVSHYSWSGPSFVDGIDRPACTPGAVSVGAVYDSASAATTFPVRNCSDPAAAAGAVPCFSQSGPTLSLLAPGANVTIRSSTFDGTSSAAAFVSGSVATLAGFRRALSAGEIQSFLTASGPDVTDARNSVTRKRLDVAAALVAAAAPIPDAFTSARLLTGTVTSAENGNFGAGKEAGEPNHAGDAGGASLWYRWTAPYTGPARVLTAGTNFDHVVAVYTGSQVGSLTQVVAQKPPVPGGGPMPAVVSFNATTGTTYSIAIDGQTVGPILQRGVARVTINGPPVNDAFSAAIPLVLNTTVTGQNFGGTRQPGELDHCGNDGGASVWYYWDATVTRNVIVETGLTGFPLRCVYVWRSPLPNPTAPGGLQYVAGALWATPDDTTRASFAATSGVRYYIAVDGISSEQPPFTAPQTGQFSIQVR